MKRLLCTLVLLRGRVPLRVLLLVVATVGLLSGPAAFGLGEPIAEAVPLDEIRKLLASDAQAGDAFGLRVAVSGDTAIVGAHGEDAGGSEAGAAYVLQRDQGGADNWGEVKKLTASDAQADDIFGWRVTVDGDTAVVGAHGVGAFNAGAAYVFQRDQGGADNWGEVKKLTASDAQSGDIFGASVAVSGDTAVIGAYGEDAGGSDAGAAYVFQRDQGGADNWGEVKKLTASDAQSAGAFGYSVAVSGDTTIVGAAQQDAGPSNAGAAYVFQRDQGGADNWGEVKKLAASDAQTTDRFGTSVDVGGDTAVVGAPLQDAAGSDAGAAYVFQRDQGGANNWGEVKKRTASDAQASDTFGTSVAVSGDTAVIGANGEDAGGSAAGAAYVFQRDQGGADNWGEVKKLTASDAQGGDYFGTGVAVSGDTAVIGAYAEDAGGSVAGAAYVFQQPPEADGDGYGDPQQTLHRGPTNTALAFDNCPVAPNPGQENTDGNYTDNSPPYAPAVDDKTWPNSDAEGDACDADDDNDGRSDTDEATGSGCVGAVTNPLLRDTDGDRFLDGAECALSTDPTSAVSKPAATLVACGPAGDTDGDKISDRIEFCYYGTNPANSDSDGDKALDGAKDGCEAASFNVDRIVNVADMGMLATAISNPAFRIVNIDVNKDGVWNPADQGIVASFISPAGQCPG